MFFLKPKRCTKCRCRLGRVFYEVLVGDSNKELYCVPCGARLRKKWETAGVKVEEGESEFQLCDSWGKTILFPAWFPVWFLWSLTGGEKREQIKDLYKRWGFIPYAIELIVIGIIFLLIFLDMGSYSQKHDRVISNISGWALIIGVGYFLFKLLLVGVSKIAEAAKTGVAKAPPPAPATTPPDDIETRLQRLEGLKEKGLLTDAEYQAKREEILGEV